MQATMQLALDTEKDYEIVNGVAEAKEMPGARHAMIASRLDRRLGNFVEATEIRTVTIFRSMEEVQVFAKTSILESPDLLPGFRCPLAEVFPATAPLQPEMPESAS